MLIKSQYARQSGGTVAVSNNEISDPVFQAVHNVLTQVLGETATQLIYKHLENRYALRQGEFLAKIDLFAKGFETFLQKGAIILERRIIKEIYLRQGLAPDLELACSCEKPDFATQVRFALQKA